MLNVTSPKAFAESHLRAIFEESALVFLPDDSRTWTRASLCVWEAPHYTTYRYPLSAKIKQSEQSTNVLTTFFRKTLKIPNISYIQELRWRRKCNITDAEVVEDIYSQLHKRATDETKKQNLRYVVR